MSLLGDTNIRGRRGCLNLNGTEKKKCIHTEYKAIVAKRKQLVDLGRIFGSSLYSSCFSPSLKLYQNCCIFRMSAVQTEADVQGSVEPNWPGFHHFPAQLDTCMWYKQTQIMVWNKPGTISFSHYWRTGTSLAQHPHHQTQLDSACELCFPFHQHVPLCVSDPLPQPLTLVE